MNPLLIGYFPRRPFPAPAGFDRWGVLEVASIGHYTSEGPPNWIDQYVHNEFGFFESEALARKVVARAIQIKVEPDPQADPPWHVSLSRERGVQYYYYAYKLFPFEFVQGKRNHFAFTPVHGEPPPGEYEKLGYDVVSRSPSGCFFECSPLFCNGRAADNLVNRYCLLDAPEHASILAAGFSGRNGNGCEPGNYFVFEIWRKLGCQAEATS